MMNAVDTSPVTPPPSDVRRAATERLAALATPAGALGRLGELGVWLAAAQGQVPPAELERVRCVVFAGDHGVAAHGVSAYPQQITGAMVRTIVSGRAGVSALARAHDVSLRVLDISCLEDFADLPAEVSGHKVRAGSGAIHLEDALTAEETQHCLALGAEVAAQEIAQGAQVLISGDMGIGNTTPAAAMVAAALGLPAAEVTGRGTGVDDPTWDHKVAVVQQALDRAGARTQHPVESLAALSSPDLAVSTGFMVAAARAGVPVLLDGLMAVACALQADRIAPGAAAWFVAGHRSTEPAQSLALDKLGLDPVLDLGMRLGEGSGAVAAVPTLRAATAVLRDVALLSELLG